VNGRLACALFLLLFATASSAQLQPTWVKDDVNWKQYGKFLVLTLDLSNVRVIKPPHAQDDPSDWDISLEDREGIQALFRDVMKEELEEKGGYPLVYAAGDDVIEVEVELLSVMPWLKPGGDDTYQGFTVKTLGTGELTARVALRDSVTRALLLMIEGDKAVGEQYKEFTRANTAANVEAMFRRFASNLRASMDRVQGE
jgi:hypothetical protein